MHDCASILDSIAKKTSCSHYFMHGASLHHLTFSRMIFTLVAYTYTCVPFSLQLVYAGSKFHVPYLSFQYACEKSWQ